MRTDEWLEVQLHSFLTSGLEGGDWSDSNTERFTSGERAPGRRWLRVWVGPRKGASISEKGKNHDHWVAQNLPYSLHRLGYPGSYLLLVRMSDESASWTLRFTLKKKTETAGYIPTGSCTVQGLTAGLPGCDSLNSTSGNLKERLNVSSSEHVTQGKWPPYCYTYSNARYFSNASK